MYRDDRPRCPTCAESAEGYDAVWDYYRCANGHRWDGPVNGGPPGAERIRDSVTTSSPDAGGPTSALGPVRLRGSGYDNDRGNP